jgi:hypothetical protein
MWWLVYDRCDECDAIDCLQCRRADRSLTLRAVKAIEAPQNALNGPCATSQEIIDRMGKLFEIDERTGKVFFKVL